MEIGYLKCNYPEKRTIIGKVDNVIYKKISNKNNLYSYIRFLERFLEKIFNKKSKIRNYFKYKSLLKKDVDIYHFFNDINYGKEKYITTFETCVPRSDIFMQDYNNKMMIDSHKVEKELSILAKQNCKNILAISNCTKKIQLEILKTCSNDLKNAIEKKIEVIHPPQEAIFNSYNEKVMYLNDEITFIFIGRHFYRKGGYELTKAFNNICENFNDSKIKLILIGDINNKSDYTKKVLDSEVEEIKYIINKNKKIEYFNELENDKVIELIKKSNVGFLTTWADTYGYSVLEMQASGCPVVTTNVRALPEINNNESGWIINLPLTELGEADYFNENSRKDIRNILLNELEKIFIEIINNQDIIRIKGTKSLERIKKYHNLEDYNKKLSQIYINSIKDN